MSDTTILDLSIINEAKETMGAKFPLMVEYFLEDTVNYIATIRDGISTSNVERIVSPAHTLKSSARQMGALRVSEIAKNMELLAREQSTAGSTDMGPFVEMLVKLEAAFTETQSALNNKQTNQV